MASNNKKPQLVLGIGLLSSAVGFGLYQWNGKQELLPHQSAVSSTSLHMTNSSEPRITRLQREMIHVPAVLVANMDLRTALVVASSEGMSLPSFMGVLAIDNDRLSRVHARFSGEVVELGVSTDGTDPEIRVGEYVNRGDLLAVIWSAELGEKKNALVDAVTKLRFEEQTRDKLKVLFDGGAGSGRSFRDAERDAQARLIEIAGLERTLRTWRVTDEQIQELYAEAEHLVKTKNPRTEAGEWARVEVRAPISGVVLEKNIVAGEIVEAGEDLFKIGDLNQLAVWAHVYEEDLPMLESLPIPTPWTLSLTSKPTSKFTGTLDKVGAVIDPSQHTALVVGRVSNPDRKLKIGQFITATVQLPPAANEVYLPAKAVVEDGYESFVFVQHHQDTSEFKRIPVDIVRRLRDGVYVARSEAGVKEGDVLVTSGAIMLQNAMLQLPVPEDAIAANRR